MNGYVIAGILVIALGTYLMTHGDRVQSHIVLRRGSSGCVVPNHKEIRTGTVSGISKQAGVSVQEFLKNP